MQDGASVHTARSSKLWLVNNNIRQFNDGVWPSMSPDLNPIEHLWPMVGRALHGRSFASKDALWVGLRAAFGAIDPKFVQALYASMPSRMKAVRAAKGGHTRY